MKWKSGRLAEEDKESGKFKQKSSGQEESKQKSEMYSPLV